MERGESNAEMKRKHSEEDDDASHSQPLMRAKLISEAEFDLNSVPPPESRPPLDDPLPPRRNPSNAPGAGKSETIPPPFPWATNRRAMVHTLKYLNQNKINTISGDVQCTKCKEMLRVEFNVNDKFYQVLRFIKERIGEMYNRAPNEWTNPRLGNCWHCKEENCVKPRNVEKKKKTINWLFLFLGQWLGLCTLADLKYFCKHNSIHRTGAKDRLLYLTYLSLCKQLFPQIPFLS